MPHKAGAVKRAYHRAKSRAWVAKERAKRAAAGVCIRCRTPVTKYLECLDCRKARSKDYATRIRPKLQASAGRCIDCRRKCVRPGARRCGKCSARFASLVRWQRTEAA